MENDILQVPQVIPWREASSMSSKESLFRLGKD